MKQRNWIWVVIVAAIFAGGLALFALSRAGGGLGVPVLEFLRRLPGGFQHLVGQ